MDKSDRDRLNKLHEMQGQAAKNLQAVAKQMGDLPSTGVRLPQERWDKLFGVWEAANDLTQKIGEELARAYDEAMRKLPPS